MCNFALPCDCTVNNVYVQNNRYTPKTRMENQEEIKAAVRSVVSEMMDRVMDKVLRADPFVVEKHHATKPLYAALVPDEIFKGAHFERRFVTPFGSVWEKLAVAVATAHHGECLQGHTIDGTIGENSLRRIQEVLNRLEHRLGGKEKSKPDWQAELQYVRAGGGNPIPSSVTCDIFIDSRATGGKYAFELKGPLPNSDQTKVSKEKMLKLLAMDGHPVDAAYYALPYNPYGRRDNYAWSFPMRWFNMASDECVLIGDEFWNMIGGAGTYQLFIGEINKLGKAYKEQIYREFLCMEPPAGFDKDTLR